MRHRLVRVLLAVAMLVSSLTASALAQGLTGQITGTVTDAGGGVMPGATVSIKNAGTNQVREAITGADGAFQFPDLLAGTYDITVGVQGFKTYEQKGIVLGATERVGLRAITLEVGQLQETVTVTSEASLVQTTNAARSALVDREQIDDIAVKGRDFASYLKLLPGVVDTSAREAPGWGSMGGLSINGRPGGFNFSYDGVTNKDTGSNSGNYAAPALDSIAEVRVQTSNFQAEYGRSSGATITVITRSGSKDFRGSAAFYKRDDTWNGNEFSRRRQCSQGVTAQCDPAPYEFNNGAWTLGGPVLIPGTNFNAGRNKLFFFFSQDVLGRTDPGGLNERRMPTERERRGDFSQTVDAQLRPVNVRDPRQPANLACNVTGAEGPGCFPGAIIPGNLINPTAQALLNLFPLPNATPTATNQNNYTFQTVQDWPRNDQVLRMDWNVAQNTTMYGRLQFGYEKRAGGVSFLGSTGAGWPQQPSKYEIDTVSYVNTLLHTFSPTLYSELTVGVNWAHQYTSALDDAARLANDRTVVLPALRQFFPSANPDNLMPQASFTGGPGGNIGSFNVEARWPFFGYNSLWNFSGNITKIKGSHNLKTGLFVEHTTRPAQRSSTFNGSLSFNSDGSNPLNTNVGFANALLGIVTQYQEADAHPEAHGQFMNTEFYVQDNWRVKQNFTIDVGMRFYYLTPTQSEGDQVPAFNPNTWSAGAAPQLYAIVSTPQGRRARNPVTGEILPFVYAGRLVPGTGNFINGMEVFEGTPQQNNPFKLAPRIGFAWDVTGDGRTAVRGGAGVFYDRYSDDDILDLVELPPVLNTYTTNYTTLPELLASPLTATPTAVRFINEFTPPVVYNWSAGVQRDIGWNFVGDAAYVGNAARNQRVNNGAINGRPYGYAYQPASLDQTNVIGGIAQPLPDDLLRPYRGYGSITQRTYDGYADYHSLQFALNRRRSSDGLSFGVAYTRELVNKTLGAIDPFVSDNRARNYRWVTGNDGSRKHIMNINYSYEVPNLSHKWNNILVKALADNWQVSGVTSILSGVRQGFSYGYTGANPGVLTGQGSINGQGSRVNILCDPNLPRGERTFERQFRTECVGPPTDQFQLGDAINDEYIGPGFMNWDISFFKHVPMGGNRRLQFRIELYNAFNTDQWQQTSIDTSAVFNYNTRAQTDTAFGSLTGNTLSARRIQLGARFTF